MVLSRNNNDFVTLAGEKELGQLQVSIVCHVLFNKSRAFAIIPISILGNRKSVNHGEKKKDN